MEFTRRLSRLSRHRDFRRLVLVRLCGQCGDGTAQVGMASYLLFSPQSQTSAWAVAGVLALTMLPYSLLGPFISVLLDRFSRRRISVLVDVTRAVCSLALAAMIAVHRTGGGASVVLAVLLLVMLSLNRFTLAGLQAGLAGTVEEAEYLEASSIMPMIGPLAALVGGAAAGAIRLALGGPLGTDAANGLIFVLAAALFVGAAGTACRIGRTVLGPGLILDIAGYRAQRREQLTEIALDAVEKVRASGEDFHLKPLGAYERKVVHDVVAEQGLYSESEGEGTRRHVVISLPEA